MQKTFWKALPGTASKLIEIRSHWQAVEYPRLEALRDELGAKDIFINKGPTGLWSVLGFKFPEGVDVDRSVFKRLKSPDGVWRPKPDTALSKRLQESYVSNWLQRCKMLLGISEQDPRIPGIRFLPHSVLVEWSYDCWRFSPLGCSRISDIEYELTIAGVDLKQEEADLKLEGTEAE
jgi:hypothetical protein